MVLSMVFVAVCWTLQFAVHEMSDSLRLESGRSDSVNSAQANTKTLGNHPQHCCIPTASGPVLELLTLSTQSTN